MSNATLVLFAVAAIALLSPVVMAFFVHKIDKRLKSEHAQQNEVAEHAAEAAFALLTSSKNLAELTASANAETSLALAVIHTLVNSNLTEAQERELEATRAMLAAMREVIELKQDRGLPVAQETLDAVKAVEGRISALSQKVEHKQEQTKLAEKLSLPKSSGGTKAVPKEV